MAVIAVLVHCISTLLGNGHRVVIIHKPDGSTVEFEADHTDSAEQIEWFLAGSALNVIRSRT